MRIPGRRPCPASFVWPTTTGIVHAEERTRPEAGPPGDVLPCDRRKGHQGMHEYAWRADDGRYAVSWTDEARL